MSDVFISRDKVIEAIEREFGDEARPECISAKEAVYSVELADVAPVVHGRWKTDCLPFAYQCSNCKCFITGTVNIRQLKYCNICGAKMDESEGEQ